MVRGGTGAVTDEIQGNLNIRDYSDNGTYGNLLVEGNATINGNETIKGNLVVNGTISGSVSFVTVPPSGDTTGVTDRTAINAVVGICILASGKYYLDQGLTPTPTGLTGLIGQGAWDEHVFGDTGTTLVPVAAFADTAVIKITDVSHALTRGPILKGFCIDGTAPSATVDGIRATGPINAVVLEDVFISDVTGVGINMVTDASATGQTFPYGWHVKHVKIDTPGAQGVVISNHTDGVWIDTHVIGSVGQAWSIAGPCPNTSFIGCKAEWAAAGKDGFHLTGAWGSGTGSGGMTFLGCSTDRNDNHGFGITATGTVPVLISGCRLRRDGRNGGSGGSTFAGISVSGATVPVTIEGVTCFPGVDDNGGSTSSPAYGISVKSSFGYVSIDNAYLHAATAGLNNDGTGTDLKIGPNVKYAVGSTSSPTQHAGGDLTMYLTADTTPVNNSTSLVDIAGSTGASLVSPVLPPNSTWIIEGWLQYDSSTAGDIKVAFTAPSGNTMTWNGTALGLGASSATGTPIIGALAAATSAQVAGGIGVGTETAIWIRGLLTIGATAGALHAQYAQNTADATNTTIKAGSWLRLRQIA